jgi:hypothetical protein
MEYGVAIARFLLGAALLPVAVPEVRLLYWFAGLAGGSGALLWYAIKNEEDWL